MAAGTGGGDTKRVNRESTCKQATRETNNVGAAGCSPNEAARLSPVPFVRTYVRTFVRSFVRSFVRPFVRSPLFCWRFVRVCFVSRPSVRLFSRCVLALRRVSDLSNLVVAFVDGCRRVPTEPSRASIAVTSLVSVARITRGR